MQQTSHDFRAICADVGRAYGPADAPSWGFVQPRRASAPYAPLLHALRARLHVLDDTDLNSDVGLWLTLSTAPSAPPQWCLCLSFVGLYGVFFRLSSPPLCYGASGLQPLEAFVLDTLFQHHVRLPAQNLLESPYPMTGLTNNPDPSEVLLFHLLFSDAAHLPWRTAGLRTEA